MKKNFWYAVIGFIEIIKRDEAWQKERRARGYFWIFLAPLEKISAHGDLWRCPLRHLRVFPAPLLSLFRSWSWSYGCLRSRWGLLKTSFSNIWSCNDRRTALNSQLTDTTVWAHPLPQGCSTVMRGFCTEKNQDRPTESTPQSETH